MLYLIGPDGLVNCESIDFRKNGIDGNCADYTVIHPFLYKFAYPCLTRYVKSDPLIDTLNVFSVCNTIESAKQFFPVPDRQTVSMTVISIPVI